MSTTRYDHHPRARTRQTAAPYARDMFALRSHIGLAQYQQIPSTDARENAIRKITMHGIFFFGLIILNRFNGRHAK